ncbi:hypothetical protein HNE_1543 [Hyphomonas neptunium ATCC 15444]|uniref:Uncharacterized protein n=2 Tax=Hyphomonas TaxID=85 RepID=Q0C1Y9_HYPNA|nr:hypothetical protein HNE_1543 [Hyphomonas neptunium ATCC 15444]
METLTEADLMAEIFRVVLATGLMLFARQRNRLTK